MFAHKPGDSAAGSGGSSHVAAFLTCMAHVHSSDVSCERAFKQTSLVHVPSMCLVAPAGADMPRESIDFHAFRTVAIFACILPISQIKNPPTY
jgi:hypothetical protein